MLLCTLLFYSLYLLVQWVKFRYTFSNKFWYKLTTMRNYTNGNDQLSSTLTKFLFLNILCCSCYCIACLCPTLNVSNSVINTTNSYISTTVQVLCASGYAIDPLNSLNNSITTVCTSSCNWSTFPITCQRMLYFWYNHNYSKFRTDVHALVL